MSTQVNPAGHPQNEPGSHVEPHSLVQIFFEDPGCAKQLSVPQSISSAHGVASGGSHFPAKQRVSDPHSASSSQLLTQRFLMLQVNPCAHSQP
jgi:hypothetical protein